MAILLSALAILTGLLSVTFYMLFAAIPTLGVAPLLRPSLGKTLVSLLSISLALLAYRAAPGTGSAVVVAICGLLWLGTYRFHPSRIFITLDHPPKAGAREAVLSANAPVLGYATESAAHAYPMEMVGPHHLIHDRIGHQEILVAY